MGAYTLEVQSKKALTFTDKHQRFSSVIWLKPEVAHFS